MIAELREFRRARRHLHLDPAELRNLQDARLRAVVRSAYERVPFWRKRLDAAGLTPDAVRGVADLAALPPVRKTELVAAGQSEVVARGVDTARCMAFYTSGTTGEPFTLYATADEIRVHRMIQFRALLGAGYGARDRLVVLGPGRGLPSGLHQRLGIYRRDHLWPTMPVDEQIARLRRLSPDVLWIYPSCLYAILERTGFRLSAVCRPRIVVSSAEIFGPEQKEMLRNDGGIEHFDLYGCVEFGRVAWECSAHDGLHINVDHVVLEVEGDFGRCPRTGVPLGEVVLTSLTNVTVPLLRYRLGDVVGLLHGPCRCGSPFPRITYPLGRTRDLLRTPSGLGITAGPMTHVLRARAWVARFQIIQEAYDELRLVVVPRRTPEASEIAAVERDALAYMREPMKIRVELVERIAHGPGKFRDVIVFGAARLGAMSAAAAQLATLSMKVTTTFLRRVLVLVRVLDDERSDFPLPPELRLVVVDQDLLAAYRVLRPEQDPGLIAARWARGDRCFAVLAGTRLVHATWTSTSCGPLPYLYADVELAPGDACFYDSYTAPEWRGRDVSRSRDELCRRALRATGTRRTVALIARENTAGLRTAAPLGYRAIGAYGLIRLGPLRWRWTTAYGAEALPRLVPRARGQTRS